jgi:serine protease
MRDCQRHGAKIINLSLGGSYITSAMRSLIAALYEDGILLVAAAGNAGTATAMYPAAHRDVISVTALTSELDVWENSNYGPWIELAAPGYRINSTFPPDRYALYSGTSMSVPFVSGVAALVWSHFPQCSNSQIRFALAQAAVDLGAEGCDENYGYGLVQAKTAYDFLLANPCQDADWGRESHVGTCTTVPDPSAAPTMAPSLVRIPRHIKHEESIVLSPFPHCQFFCQ